MYRQRIQKAWGHTAQRGWARLLLNRARGLITHGPAHRGVNGAAMPTDEDDQDGHIFSAIPRGGATPLPRRAQPLLLLFRSNPRTRTRTITIPYGTEGGGKTSRVGALGIQFREAHEHVTR